MHLYPKDPIPSDYYHGSKSLVKGIQFYKNDFTHISISLKFDNESHILISFTLHIVLPY